MSDHVVRVTVTDDPKVVARKVVDAIRDYHSLTHDATDDDAYAEGDPSLADVDPVELERLAARMDAVQATPAGIERNMAALGLLHELYGDALVVI